MAQIREIQNSEEAIRYRLAAWHFYRIGKWLFFGGAFLAVAFALAAPLVLLFRPELGPILGAIAGVWIFVSRIGLDRFRREYQLKGAAAQECFDCLVLGLEWNESLAKQLPDEEIRAASRSDSGADKAEDWYPADGVELDWPHSVLLCQRSNTVWARRQHAAYGRALAVSAVVWAVLGIIIAIADGASLGAYLVTIALPSLPAFLDASEVSRGHAVAANHRQLLEDHLDELLRDGRGDRQDMREVQDQLFNLRREAPLVPQWFYNVIRPRYEDEMQFAAKRLAERAGRPGSEQ
jgi:SMODS-associating 4TM effector domain